jgi:hypothetical protein
MTGRTGISLTRMRGLAVVALATLGMTDAGWPQGVAPSPTPGIREPAAPPTPSPSPRPNEESPGLLDAMGKLFEKSLSIFPTLKSLSESADDFNARAKDAGDSVSRLAKPSTMVAGRAICPASTNGAPDCKLGADKLCQAKGFKEGKSLDVDTTRNCSARSLLSGRKPDESECRTDTYVTRAVCQ